MIYKPLAQLPATSEDTHTHTQALSPGFCIAAFALPWKGGSQSRKSEASEAGSAEQLHVLSGRDVRRGEAWPLAWEGRLDYHD